jgi:hypothetical protein
MTSAASGGINIQLRSWHRCRESQHSVDPEDVGFDDQTNIYRAGGTQDRRRCALSVIDIT